MKTKCKKAIAQVITFQVIFLFYLDTGEEKGKTCLCIVFYLHRSYLTWRLGISYMTGWEKLIFEHITRGELAWCSWLFFFPLLQAGFGVGLAGFWLCWIFCKILESEHGNSCSLGRGSDIIRNNLNTESKMFEYICIY